MLERMGPQHVDAVARIHGESWSPHEISVKLGRGYQRMFYGGVVRSPHAFGWVYTDNGRVVGYATGFRHYEKFNDEARRSGRVRLAFLALKGLLTGKLKLADIRNLADDAKKLRKLKHPEHHLGALALDPAYKGTPTGKTAITEVIDAVVNEFRDTGCGGCWGVCDDRNVPMKKYLVRLGFDEVDQVEFPDKKVVVFERLFAAHPAAGAAGEAR